jgi:hypothetical protein
MRLPGWIVLLLTLVVSCGSGSDSDAPATVLVFSHTTGFRHPSIEAGVEAIRDLGAANGFTVDHTEDPSFFTAENLAQYDAIVFLSTTGNPLDDASQRGALEGYIRAGGGFVGIHAASDQDAGELAVVRAPRRRLLWRPSALLGEAPGRRVMPVRSDRVVPRGNGLHRGRRASFDHTLGARLERVAATVADVR